MQIFVTGSTGFIGSHITKALIDEGHRLRLLSRSPDKIKNQFGGGCEVYPGDLSNTETLLKAIDGCDAVFHIAGLVGYSKAMYQNMVTTNVIGTSNIVDACLKAQTPRLVYMSSVVAIGASETPNELNEDSPYKLSHLNLGYSLTKRKAEEIVTEACTKKNLNAVILNPTTVYGAGDAEKGSRKVQVKVAKGKFPFYTSGGVNVVHIDDVVSATLTAWKKGQSGRRYILGSENLYIKELFAAIAKEAGVRRPWIGLPDLLLKLCGYLGDYLEAQGKSGPINSENAKVATLFHWFSNERAKKELGLNPKPAIEGISDSVRWMKESGLLR